MWQEGVQELMVVSVAIDIYGGQDVQLYVLYDAVDLVTKVR